MERLEGLEDWQVGRKTSDLEKSAMAGKVDGKVDGKVEEQG